jgi:hypothetical protein
MKVSKWYLVLLGGLITLLVFAILVYVFKTPTRFAYSPNNWDLIYDFLDKWASAGAPAITLLAVVVALGIGLAGILQTRNIQKNEHRRRLLGEILNWAQNIFSDGVINNMMQLADAIREAGTTGGMSIEEEWKRFSQERAGINQYITEIALCFDKPLKDAVEKPVTDLEKYTKTLRMRRVLSRWPSPPK